MTPVTGTVKHRDPKSWRRSLRLQLRSRANGDARWGSPLPQLSGPITIHPMLPIHHRIRCEATLPLERVPSIANLAGLEAEFAVFQKGNETRQVRLVAGQVPSDPPSWLAGQNTPKLGAPQPTGDPKLPPIIEPANAGGSGTVNANPAVQPLPGFPPQAGAGSPLPPSSGSANRRPALGAPTMPPVSQSLPMGLPAGSRQTMSDTQRGAMHATDLIGAEQPGSAPDRLAPTNQPNTVAAPGSVQPSAQPGTRSTVAGAEMGDASAASEGPAQVPGAASLGGGAALAPMPSPPTAAPATIGTPSAIQPNPSAGSTSIPMPTATDRTRMSASVGPASPAAGRVELVSNQPGNRYLDGSQNANLVFQKRAPEEIQVGKPATFVITVRNTGNTAIHDVVVVDSVPRGVTFVEAIPATQPTADGVLSWKLDEISAGEERTITTKLVPEVQGEIGSVASIHMAALASVRTVATLPKIEIELDSQSDVLIGDSQQIDVTIRNTGTGVAQGVRLEADIPEHLRHQSGNALLQAVLGNLHPNDTKRISLDLSAVQPGASECVVRAISDDGLRTEERIAIDVRAPKLEAKIQGPKLRYLERQAVFQVSVHNTGTAAATNLDFVIHLPAGLKFNSANHHGTYDPNTHTVSWGLYELPAATKPAIMELVVLPVELGPQVLTLAANGDLGITAEAQSQVEVQGLAQLAFTIGQDNGTIEVGATSTYSVQVTNIGNKPE